MADEPVMDERFWEEKAGEARSIAKELTTSPARLEMLGLAAAYSRLATHARHRGRLPWSLSTSPILSCDTERSRCHRAFPGSDLARREMISCVASNSFRAAGTSPCVRSTPPIRSWLKPRSNCHPAFPGVGLGEAVPNGERGLVKAGCWYWASYFAP